jgi:hypothetical protein
MCRRDLADAAMIAAAIASDPETSMRLSRAGSLGHDLPLLRVHLSAPFRVHAALEDDGNAAHIRILAQREVMVAGALLLAPQKFARSSGSI